MLALPLLFAPLRALIGFRSDNHRSVLGWRRVPFIWMGTMLQFGGLAIMPFALLILSGDTTGPIVIGQAAAALAFLLVGAGLHTVQTVGLALATDLAPAHARPRVVALLCAMLLLGMAVLSEQPNALIFNDHPTRMMIHVHCHAKSLANSDYMYQLAIRLPQRTVMMLEAGCCGMAGGFGMSESKYKLSVKIAEPMIQVIRSQPFGNIVVASGTSCRRNPASRRRSASSTWRK